MSVSETLKVMREKVHSIEIRMTYEREKEEPKVFEHFNIHLILRGEALSPSKVEKALHISEEKTCPVSIMMQRAGAKVTTTFAIEETTRTISAA